VCSSDDLCPILRIFEAEIFVVDLPEKKQIMANGYQCILHMHTIIEECNIDILGEIERKTKTEIKVKFIRSQTKARVVIKTVNAIFGKSLKNSINWGDSLLEMSESNLNF
jgi:peptide chain release factor subunit 3